MPYTVKNGDTIYDVAYNTAGSLSALDLILETNDQDVPMLDYYSYVNNGWQVPESNFMECYTPKLQIGQIINTDAVTVENPAALDGLAFNSTYRSPMQVDAEMEALRSQLENMDETVLLQENFGYYGEPPLEGISQTIEQHEPYFQRGGIGGGTTQYGLYYPGQQTTRVGYEFRVPAGETKFHLWCARQFTNQPRFMVSNVISQVSDVNGFSVTMEVGSSMLDEYDVHISIYRRIGTGSWAFFGTAMVKGEPRLFTFNYRGAIPAGTPIAIAFGPWTADIPSVETVIVNNILINAL